MKSYPSGCNRHKVFEWFQTMLTFGCGYPTGCRIRRCAYTRFQEETHSFHQNQKFWKSIFWKPRNPLRREEMSQSKNNKHLVENPPKSKAFSIVNCHFWLKTSTFRLFNISSRRRGFLGLQKMDFQNFWFWWKLRVSSWKRVYAHLLIRQPVG